MKFRLLSVPVLASALCVLPGLAQQPAGVADALGNLTSQPATKTTFTFDRDMLEGLLGSQQAAALNSVTLESFHYSEPAFYVPEAMSAMAADYAAAGWKHLVEANAGPRESASPTKPITDLWLHFQGTEIDHLTVLIRARREMTVIEVSGLLRPLDLVHLGGHFGIPRMDPNAVMVPAPPGK